MKKVGKFLLGLTAPIQLLIIFIYIVGESVLEVYSSILKQDTKPVAVFSPSNFGHSKATVTTESLSKKPPEPYVMDAYDHGLLASASKRKYKKRTKR